MSWLFDNIPWWVYLLIAGGGGGALLALVPGVLVFVIGVYNAMPTWLKWLTGMAIVAALAHIAGRNIAAANARARQKQLDDKSIAKAKEVRKDVEKLSDKQVDEALEKEGGFWPDRPPPKRPVNRRDG